MKRSLLLWISFIAFLTTPLLHAAEAAEPSDRGSALREILILNSYHPGYAWSDDEQAGIIDVLRAKDENGLPVIEYLDLKRLPDGRHLAELKQLFRSKYQNKKFSVVIAMDNPALEFATDNHAELFRNAPIVFCGINDYKSSLLQGHPDVAGIAESMDIAGTIEVMLRLHPAAREIFVPHDYTVTGLAVRKEIEALVPRFGAKVRFRFTDPLTMGELLKELERLPKDSLVLEIGFITDKSGCTFGMTETTKLFSEHSPVPIYSTFEQRLSFGIVGGKLLSARHHGTHAARIAMRVLAGEKASAIPVILESDSQFMFDYKVMKRFGIPLSALPEGSIVINKTVSFYTAHQMVIQATVGIIGFLVVVISLLAINIIQRRRAAEVIRRSEEKFKVITSSTPDYLLVQDSDLRYSFVVNPPLGLTEQDMIGKTDYDFLSKEDADKLTEIKRQVLKTGRPVHVEVPLTSSTGGQQFFDGFYVPKFDAKGQADGLIGYFRNVTERKEEEKALRKSQEKLIEAHRLAHIGVWNWFAETDTVLWTEELYRIAGIDPMLPAPTYAEHPNIYAPESWDLLKEAVERAIKTGEPYNLELKLIRPDGTTRWINAFGGATYDNHGRIEGIQGTVQDITERKQAEEALRRAEENFRLSLDDSSLGVRIVTIEGESIYANRAILDFYGYDSIEEFNTTPVKKRYTPESYAGFQIRREIRKRRGDGLSEYDISIVRKDGEVRHLHVFRKPTLWDGEEQFQVIYQDITERKRLEEGLLASREQMRALAGRLQEVREVERTDIAREIHDELGGALTGMKVDVSFLIKSALKIENEAARTSLLVGMDSVTKAIDTTIHAVRRIAMELRPGILDDLGLVAALEWQLKDFEKRTGIRCEFFPPGEDISLDADLSTALFRIFQEALTNVVRHSGATEVHVRLRTDADAITLEVEDNGQGIEKDKANSKESLGLLGMRERAQILGGRITVTGTPGTGTKVTVEIPPSSTTPLLAG